MSTDTSPLRRAIFENYRDGQGNISSGHIYRNIEEPWPYYRENYGRHLLQVHRDAQILEIGSGPGSLLAWLESVGFSRVSGVDASPGDVAFANGHLKRNAVALGDGRAYLEDKPATYDVIIAKAVLEHLPKDDLLPFVRAIAGGLKLRGIAVIDVPNMDWLLASHERYMDLTHETGFTRESMRALLELVFEEVEIRGSVIPSPTRAQRLFRRPLLSALRRILYVLGEGASETLFESRSIIAVAHRADSSAARG